MDINQLENLPYYIVAIVFILWGLMTVLLSLSLVRKKTNLGLIRGFDVQTGENLQDISDSGESFFESIRKGINRIFSFISSEEMKTKLIRADWNISVTEYFLIQYSVMLLGFLLFWLTTGQIISGVGFVLIVFFIPGLLLNQNVRKRQAQFQEQLLDALTLITGAVRVGFSFLQSLDVAIKELPDPASREFAEVKREMDLGVPLSESLISLSDRMGSEDLFLVVTAININTQVGGNLTVILEAISNTISERIKLLGEIRVLTTYARYSSYLLSALPFIAAGAIFLTNPDYISELLEPGIGQFILGAALVMVLIGNVWIRRIANVEI